MSSVLDEIEKFKKQQENKAQEAPDNQIVNEEQNTRQTTSEQVPDTLPPAVTAQEGLNRALGKAINEATDIKSLTKNLTYLAGASNLQNDKDFTDKYQKTQGEQLIKDLEAEGKRQAIVDAAKKQEAKNQRATAYFSGCKPIFDLLGIDKAFGLVPMIITTMLLMIPFLAVSLIRFVANSINSIATAISGFKKPAFWMCTIILCLLVTAAAVLAALYGIDKIFGTAIILR